MGYLGVLVAAVAAYAFGAVWYMTLSKPWIKASGIEVDESGKPVGGGSVVPFIVAFGSNVLVAGMMRHIFALSDIDTVEKGLVSGLGIGLFLACPWLLTCYSFGGRPVRLSLIDGGNVTIGCAIIGVVLTLF